MATSSTQSRSVEQQASRWLAERARPFADAPLQKRSAQQFISLSKAPRLPTPRHAIEAVEEYLRDGTVYYTFHDGMPELRDAIARKLARENGLTTTRKRRSLSPPGRRRGCSSPSSAPSILAMR